MASVSGTGSTTTLTGSTTTSSGSSPSTGTPTVPTTPVVTIKPGVTKGPNGVTLFTDMKTHWASDYVVILAMKNIINSAALFRPDDSLTRAEFLKIVGNSAGWDLASSSGTVLPFGDVSKGVWYEGYVKYALKTGTIMSQSKFRPNDTITRGEVAKILYVALGLDTKMAKLYFVDVSGTPLTTYTTGLRDAGIFEGQMMNGARFFRPNDSITRAEISKVIVKTFFKSLLP